MPRLLLLAEHGPAVAAAPFGPYRFGRPTCHADDMHAGEFRQASAIVRAAKVEGWSGSRVDNSWNDESVVRWRVDVEVQPSDEPPFAATCDLGLLGAYSVTARPPHLRPN